MKIALIFIVFTLFAFAATGNANAIKKPGELNMTAKFQKKLKEITDKIPEPIVLSEKNIELNTENVQLDATFNGSISGITNLAVNDFKVSILGGLSISSFEFVLPKLSVDITSYDLDGKLGLTHIFGKGKFFLNLENFVLKGSAQLKITTVNDCNNTQSMYPFFIINKSGIQYVQIKSITANHSMNIENFNFKITGWLNDEYLSEFLSNLINIVMKNMPPEVKAKFDENLSSILTRLLADIAFPLNELTKP